jgi:beta-glucanase (GH16 family)
MTRMVLWIAVLVACGVAIAGAGSTRAPERARYHATAIVWSDEFNGRFGRRPSPHRWRFEIGGHWGAGELQYYTDRVGRKANAALDGRGHLVITAREERYTGRDGTTRRFTSARLNSSRLFSFKYGRIDARMRVASGQGLISAFWALGANIERVGWPQSGEFDVAEVLGARPSVVWGSMHGPDEYGSPYSVNTEHDANEPLDRAFHVYSVSWSPDRLEYFLDGQRYAVYEPGMLEEGRGWAFEDPFFLVLTLSVGGAWAGPPDESTRLPSRLVIDWIRVRRNASTECETVAIRRFRERCGRS